MAIVQAVQLVRRRRAMRVEVAQAWGEADEANPRIMMCGAERK